MARIIGRAAAAALVVGTLLTAAPSPRSVAVADQSVTTPPRATTIDYLPNVSLIDQTGRNFVLSSAKGKLVLVSFIHTSCQGVCEQLTAKMKTVAHDVGPAFASKMTLVSVTTDPREDGPRQLATYAKSQDAVGNGWVFLTGKPTDIEQVLKLYGVPADTDEDALNHVLELRLIGPDGRELHRYDSNAIQAAAVAGDVKTALAHD